jgi:hypothetical protein
MQTSLHITYKPHSCRTDGGPWHLTHPSNLAGLSTIIAKDVTNHACRPSTSCLHEQITLTNNSAACAKQAIFQIADRNPSCLLAHQNVMLEQVLDAICSSIS